MIITITRATMNGRPAYRASMVSSTGKTFNWHVREDCFAFIESQAIAYENSELEMAQQGERR